MGLFSFLSKKRSAVSSAGLAQEMVTCDIAKTLIVTELFDIPQELRGEAWLKEFYDNVATAAFVKGDPATFTGPDGFIYFILRTPPTGNQAALVCIQNIKNDCLLNNGFGVVINPERN